MAGTKADDLAKLDALEAENAELKRRIAADAAKPRKPATISITKAEFNRMCGYAVKEVDPVAAEKTARAAGKRIVSFADLRAGNVKPEEILKGKVFVKPE